MRIRFYFVLRIAMAWLVVGSAAFAQDCAELGKDKTLTKEGPVKVLAALHSRGCLGEDNDEGELTTRVVEEIDRIANDKDAVTQIVTLTNALKRLVDLAATALPSGQPGRSPASAMRVEMQALLRKLDAGGQLGTGLLNHEAWDFGFPNPLLPARPGGVNVEDFLNAHCPPDSEESNQLSPTCKAAFVESREAVRFARLVARILGAPADLSGLLETMVTRGKKWDAYFNEARSQYLWKLALNDRLTMKEDLNLTADGQPKGFREVPDRQYILLHPTVALQYVDAADDGEQFQEAAVAEVLGVNWWKWKGDDGSMGRAFGLSLIATASDRAGAEDLGWGLMLHFNHKYSLALTDHDGDQGILVTADLAKLWTRVSESKRFKLMTKK